MNKKLFRYVFTMLCALTLYFTARPAPAQQPPINQAAPGKPGQPTVSEQSEIHNRIKSILSSPEYSSKDSQESETSKEIRKKTEKLRKTYEAVKRWLSGIWRRIQNLFGGVRGLSGSGNFYIILFIVLFAAIIAWFLYRYFRQNQKTAAPIKTPGLSEALLDHVLVIEALSRSPEEWLIAARALASTDNYRGAVRCLFMRIICLMDRQGLLEFVPSETNRELLVRAGANLAGSQPALASIISIYETAWYGEAVTSKAGFDRMQEASASLESVWGRSNFNGQEAARAQ